jgi:hypothetical protein
MNRETHNAKEAALVPHSSISFTFSAFSRDFLRRDRLARLADREQAIKGMRLDSRRPKKRRRAMRTLWLAFMLPLAACSSIMPVTGGDENGGTVRLVATAYGEDNAMDVAREHCSQYHRIARKHRTDAASNTMTFTCEVPGRVFGPDEVGRP